MKGRFRGNRLFCVISIVNGPRSMFIRMPVFRRISRGLSEDGCLSDPHPDGRPDRNLFISGKAADVADKSRVVDGGRVVLHYSGGSQPPVAGFVLVGPEIFGEGVRGRGGLSAFGIGEIPLYFVKTQSEHPIPGVFPAVRFPFALSLRDAVVDVGQE